MAQPKQSTPLQVPTLPQAVPKQQMTTRPQQTTVWPKVQNAANSTQPTTKVTPTVALTLEQEKASLEEAAIE